MNYNNKMLIIDSELYIDIDFFMPFIPQTTKQHLEDKNLTESWHSSFFK